MSTDDLPGTYRIADGTKINFSDAMAAWIPLAHEELIATATRYHAVITYRELSERVQELSGITTRMLLANWIGKLLEGVARLAKANNEPPLTSLCVHQDGTIGLGYSRAPKSTPDVPGDDIEIYAARHRLLCYQQFAANVPADGGVPALTSAERMRRDQKVAQNPLPRPSCPGCFTELPARGICDYCD